MITIVIQIRDKNFQKKRFSEKNPGFFPLFSEKLGKFGFI